MVVINGQLHNHGVGFLRQVHFDAESNKLRFQPLQIGAQRKRWIRLEPREIQILGKQPQHIRNAHACSPVPGSQTAIRLSKEPAARLRQKPFQEQCSGSVEESVPSL